MIERIEVKYNASRQNCYNVPAKQWRKWETKAREVFNHVYSAMNGSQAIFTHPKMAPLPVSQWKTICWNAAWEAASAA